MIDVLDEIATPIVKRCVEYLVFEVGIEAKIQDTKLSKRDILTIKNSSQIAISGSVDVVIAMGYENTLFEELIKYFLQGEDVSDDEIMVINESISGEIINIIVGNAITNPMNGSMLNITTPFFIDSISSMFEEENSNLISSTIETKSGKMAVVVKKN